MKEYIARRIAAIHVTDADGVEVPADLIDSLGVSLISNEAVAAPTLGPAIADRTYVVGGAPVTIDLSQRFIGAISYGMTPANIPGVTRSGATVTIDPVQTRAATEITVSGTNAGGTVSMTFTLTINAVSPTLTAPLPDQSLTVGDANVILALGSYFADAASYTVSPTGQGVTLSGSNLTISAAAERNASYTVTASNSTGQTVSDSFALLVSAVAAPMSRLAVHVDADIDTVGERDDIAAMALWLGNQDDFNLLGFTCSPPDGNHQEYINCINAYETDRPTIIAKPGINSADFKTGAELLALVQDGANADAPARGYRLVGESQYDLAHAAAQLLIANARDHGDPTSADPTRKLWVAVQGGYVTLAQALYEACDPAGPMELPDILDRIRVVGQPNWNSSRAPNSWNYIFGNAWPASGTPGMFGDLWMLCGYLQWHAFNRDNGTTDTTFWNDVTARSAFGQHLRDTLTRPSASFTSPHFRAGDAGIWFWLKSAKDLGNFDPTNPANLCGAYRTYEGVNPWPSQTVGYGAGSGIQTGNPNPEGVTWSPTIWAPELTVSSYEAAYAAVDLNAWYSMVAGYMDRYQTLVAPSQVAQPSATGTGTSRTITWTAPDDGGSPITDYVIRIDGAVVADGGGTGTSYDTGVLADGIYSVTVAAVNAIGEGSQSSSVTINIGDVAGPPSTLVGEWEMMTSGSIPEANGADLTGVYAAPNSDPSVEAEGTFFDGNDYAVVSATRSAALNNIDNAAFVAIILPGNLPGDRIFLARDNGGANGHFQFRTQEGVLQFVDRRQTTAIAADTETVVSGEAYVVSATVSGGQIVLRKNGVQVASVATTNTPYSLSAELTFGCRQATSGGIPYADRYSGRVAYSAIWKDFAPADIATAEQRAIDAVAGRSPLLDALSLT